jgi:peroxiredoxin
MNIVRRSALGGLIIPVLFVAELAAGAIPTGAENTQPLKAGELAPTAIVKTVDGADFDLGRAVAARPTILIFYRGGWCPFCNRQLGGIQAYEQKFIDLGYQILAVGTDRPEVLRQTIAKDGLGYTLLSDRDMTAAAAFHVAYRVAGDDAKKYASYHIDLPPIPGDAGEVWLPVPSIFVIARDRTIRFAESNPNYRIRPPPEEILAAAARVKIAWPATAPTR